MNGQSYYLGIDGGTSSVGWAVSTPDYKIIKKGGRALWGTRLFEEAETGEKRRTNRIARRRRGRQVNRKKLLRELFSHEIAKVDPAFYLRLDESKFWEEDKKTPTKYCLFADKDWTDRDYYKKYPTIYHLRLELMEKTDPHDVRLVYLAISHIISHRGHFLYAGQQFSSTPDFAPLWMETVQCLKDALDLEVSCDTNALQDALSEQMKIAQKQKVLAGIFENSKDERIKCITELLSGKKSDISKLLGIKPDKEDLSSLKISFHEDAMDSDETLDTILSYSEEGIAVLEHLKGVYDWGILNHLLGCSNTFSAAQKAIYEKHSRDLKRLKMVIRRVSPENYSRVFRKTDKEGNYALYSGHYNRTDKNPDSKYKSQEELYKTLKKILGKSEDKDAKDIMAEIDRGSFVPKQHTKANSVIPYQLHLNELRKILDNASAYLPFLNEKDEDGYSVREKIESLVTFRIPYYVGPLDHHGDTLGKHWAVKKRNARVLPWNFDLIVDKKASAEAFMDQLTNTCTYLTGETVLPKDSIRYSRFMVLNELNNVRIHGEKMSAACKQNVFLELFCKKQKVTFKALCDYLEKNGYIEKGERDSVTGTDGDFKASLRSEIRMMQIFGDHLPDVDVMEDLIRAVLLLKQEPVMLQDRIRTIMPDITDEQMRKVCRMSFSGWGRLSKAFLCDIKSEVCAGSGSQLNILEALWQTDNNLMQLLSSRFSYTKRIDEHNRELAGEAALTYKTVENLAVSPATRRTIWQTLKIVKEIEHIMGCAPKKVFIEVARGAENGGRTVSRRLQLMDCYKKLSEEVRGDRDWLGEFESRSDADFRRDALYLYYTQMGRCMYTGEPIDLNDLMNKKRFDALYDIDHIWPQSKIKDDSIENRVLVKKMANQNKKDRYPIEADIRHARFLFWKSLYDNGLIGKKKWERLIRSKPFEEEELAGFISRQLVETRQSTKAIAAILKEALPDTNIVYVKAGNVSDFRHLFDFVKVRELNDLHHAKDAYLNIVVGNVFDTKFTANPLNFIKSNEKYSLRPEVLFREWNVERNGEQAWIKGEHGSIETVQAVMRKNNIMVTRQTVRKNSGQNGGLFDQNPKRGGVIPLKGSEPRLQNTERYGGYNGDTGAYMTFVEHTVRKKRVRSFVPVYLRFAEKIDKDPEKMIWYCEEILGLQDVRILVKEMKYNTLLNLRGFSIYVTGRTDNRLIGQQEFQLVLSPEMERYVKKVLKVAQRRKAAGADIAVSEQYDGVTLDMNQKLYEELLHKHDASVYQHRPSSQKSTMEKGKDKFAQLSISKQCEVLEQILQLFYGRGQADLSDIGGSPHAGKVVLTGSLDGKNGAKMILSSVTGFYRKEIDLMKL